MIVLLLLSVVGLASSSPVEWEINAPNCGVQHSVHEQTGQHIIGGEVAIPHEYPWVTAMYHRGSHSCGGSYIKGNNGRSYILTAAHCTEGTNPNQWQMRLGRHDLSITEATAQHIDVDQINNHPNYHPVSLEWDVALMRLSTNPTETSAVHHGCIPINDKIPNEIATVAGWGSLDEDGSVYPDLLHKLQKPILSHDTCRQYLGSNDFKDSNMLCSAHLEGGKDSCYGDSGGPLMARRGRKEIVGIVSWGFGCAQENSPGVYQNVARSKSWIDGIINA